MKKLILFIVLIMSALSVYAANFNKIVFFGDSLSDDGNLYSALFHVIPKSPPYFKGRFSNGETWAEYVGNYYYQSNYAGYKNYATGGATTIFHKPSLKFVAPTLLEIEIDMYLLDSIFKNRSDALYAIWIGGNDYLFDYNADANQLTDKVTHKIGDMIKKLRRHGAKNFLILNLPDLSKAPEAANRSITNLQTLTLLHNQKLDAVIQTIQNEYPELSITSVNVYDVLNDVIANTEKYNQKYQVNLTNTTESCWKGGMLLSKTLTEASVANDIRQSLKESHQTLPQDLDVQAMSQFIINTPELAYSYQMSQSFAHGNVPCGNPDSYLFWDGIHPTAVIHNILGQIVVEQLNQARK